MHEGVKQSVCKFKKAITPFGEAENKLRGQKLSTSKFYQLHNVHYYNYKFCSLFRLVKTKVQLAALKSRSQGGHVHCSCQAPQHTIFNLAYCIGVSLIPRLWNEAI